MKCPFGRLTYPSSAHSHGPVGEAYAREGCEAERCFLVLQSVRVAGWCALAAAHAARRRPPLRASLLQFLGSCL